MYKTEEIQNAITYLLQIANAATVGTYGKNLKIAIDAIEALQQENEQLRAQVENMLRGRGEYMDWCKGCYRDANRECEAFRAPWEGCFAKETNRDKYIREQKKLLRYNLTVRNKRGIEACRESLQRVQGAID